MGVCEIGEKKKIGRLWYTKKEAPYVGSCGGCSIAKEAGKCCLFRKEGGTHSAIEDRGAECYGTIWVSVSPRAKPTKPAPKAKWEPADFRKMLPKRPTIAMYEAALEEATETVNKLGAESARLKNQLRKAKP